MMEKGLGYRGDQEPDGRSSWAAWSYVEEKSTEGQTSLQHSTDLGFIYGGVAKLNPLFS